MFDERGYSGGGYRTALSGDPRERLGLDPEAPLSLEEIEAAYRVRRRWWVRVNELYMSGRRHGHLPQAGPLAGEAMSSLAEARRALREAERPAPGRLQAVDRPKGSMPDTAGPLRLRLLGERIARRAAGAPWERRNGVGSGAADGRSTPVPERAGAQPQPQPAAAPHGSARSTPCPPPPEIAFQPRTDPAGAGADSARFLSGAGTTLVLGWLLLLREPGALPVALSTWPLPLLLSLSALGCAWILALAVRRRSARGAMLAATVLLLGMVLLGQLPSATPGGLPPLSGWLLLSALPWPAAMLLPECFGRRPGGVWLPVLLAALAFLIGAV